MRLRLEPEAQTEIQHIKFCNGKGKTKDATQATPFNSDPGQHAGVPSADGWHVSESAQRCWIDDMTSGLAYACR
jgi:hypothetical protein